MEQLFKDLHELGYTFEWDNSFKAWKICDFSGDVSDYIAYGFPAVILRHGFTFSFSIRWDTCEAFVRFVKLNG